MSAANLFQQYLKPVRSVMEYGEDLDKAESNQLALVAQRGQNEIAGLKAQEARAGLADAAAKRNAIQEVYAKLGQTATPEDRFRALQANPLTAAEGMAAEKQFLENNKTRAVIGKDEAETKAKLSDQRYQDATRHAQRLALVRDPAGIVSYIDEGIQSGVFPKEAREQMLQQANKYPSVDAWKAAENEAAIPVLDRYKKEAEMARAKLAADTQIQTNAATNATSRANNNATVGVQRDRLKFDREQAGVANGAGGSISLPGFGKAPPGYMWDSSTQPPTLKSIKGGPADSGAKPSAEVQRQIGGVIAFDKDLAVLEEALKDFDPRSADQTNTTKRAKIQSLGKQAQLSAKEAAALGALSGPDMALLEGILNDPTSIKGAISGGAGIAAQIKEARAGNKRRVQSIRQQYGDRSIEGLPEDLKTPDAAPPKPAASGWSMTPVPK